MITIGAPFAGMARELGALYGSGQASLPGIVGIATRYGLRLEE
jgi:hypothetical protein